MHTAKGFVVGRLAICLKGIRVFKYQCIMITASKLGDHLVTFFDLRTCQLRVLGSGTAHVDDWCSHAQDFINATRYQTRIRCYLGQYGG